MTRVPCHRRRGGDRADRPGHLDDGFDAVERPVAPAEDRLLRRQIERSPLERKAHVDVLSVRETALVQRRRRDPSPEDDDDEGGESQGSKATQARTPGEQYERSARERRRDDCAASQRHEEAERPEGENEDGEAP